MRFSEGSKENLVVNWYATKADHWRWKVGYQITNTVLKDLVIVMLKLLLCILRAAGSVAMYRRREA